MEKEELISVIIPVYNVMPYLKKCINSVISQTYGNLEILLIDDGSDDGSGVICDEYERQDKRIKVFHKRNGGLADARNYGLQYAAGDYIGFVDGDDYIDIHMYEHLITVMDEGVDLAACGVREEYIKRYKRMYYAYNFTCGYRLMNRREAMRELLMLRVFGFSVCNKLFKRKLFEGVFFPEGRSSEDIPVIYKIFSNANCVVSNGYADYHYVHRPGSITGGDFFDRRMDYCSFTKEILDDVSVNYPQYRSEALALYVKSAYSVMGQILNSSNKAEYRKICRLLQDVLAENEETVRHSVYIDENTRKDMLSKLEMNLDKEFVESRDVPQNIVYKDKIGKLSEFYNILIQWLSLRQKGITAGDFMRKNGYKTVAVYGMKELGELLYKELRNEGICVKYVIDRFTESVFIDVPVLKPDEPLCPVDVIVVTAVHFYEEIRESLTGRVDIPIRSLEDVLFFEYE